MNYQGDIALGDTIDFKFTSVNTSGVPTTLSGTPAVAAYVDNSTTEITAGITLTADFDSRTGLNHINVVATSGNGFATGKNINLVITAGTVSGNSVVGYVVGSFSIGKRPVNVTLWAGSATATGNIAIKNTLANGTDITGAPADSAGVTTLLGRVTSTLFTGITSVKEWLGMIAGKQTGNATARTEIRSSGAGSGTYDETTDSQEATRDRGDAAWVGAGSDPWSTLIPGAYGAGTAGNIIGNRLDAAVSTRSTYAGADTAGTTTLLSRIASALTITGGKVDVNDKTGFSLVAAYDPAKTAAQAGTAMTLTAAYDAAKTAATQNSVDTVASYVDTEVIAIKAVTDKLATMLEVDTPNWRYTKASLFNTPLGASINGNVLLWEIWRWTTSASPTGTGQVTVNNADWNVATSVKLNYTDLANTNFGTYIANVRVNDVIRLQRENDNTIWNDYTVTATGTDNGTWRDIPVIRKTGSGAVTPINGNNMLVAFFRAPDVDWTDTEKQQIRNRLGIDGTQATPAATPTLSTQALLTTVAGYVDTEVLAIKAKTDNLPTDPASASTISASFAVTNGKIDVVDDFVDTEVGAIKAKTDQLTFTGGKVDANATATVSPTDMNGIADALLKRDWNSVSGEAAYSALNAFRMLRNVWNTTGGTLTVKKEDGTTTAWTRTLSVDPTAQPITGAS